MVRSLLLKVMTAAVLFGFVGLIAPGVAEAAPMVQASPWIPVHALTAPMTSVSRQASAWDGLIAPRSNAASASAW